MEMMLESSNRQNLKLGRESTLLEQVESAGSEENQFSDTSIDTPMCFLDIVDNYRKR